MNKIKFYLQKISTAMTLAFTSLVFAPAGVSATADLTNISIGSDGKLNVPGATDGGSADSTTGIIAAFNAFIEKFKVIITGVTGILALVMVGLFIWKCFEFARASNNPSARANAITGIIVFLIAAALFGASSLFVGLAYNVFR